MPDGDRFHRRLVGTGRGWGSAYRIALNGSSDVLLADAVLKAIADNVRRISSLDRVVSILRDSVNAEILKNQGLSISKTNGFLKLDQDLKAARLGGGFDLVKLVEKSAKRVFLEQLDSNVPISPAEITGALSEILASEIMDSRFLSRIRDGLMEASNRTTSEQSEWEQRLRNDVKHPSRRLVQLDGLGIKKVRKPITRKLDKYATSSILSRGLRVL